MTRFTGWVMSAGLLMAASSAQAQVLDSVPDPIAVAGGLIWAVSDVDGPYYGGPYAAMPPEAVGPGYGYGPSLLPPHEVYTVLRDNGFLPLGAPHQRGFVYSIAVTNHRGDNGRLLIDARDGRIMRFVPDYRMSDINAAPPPVMYGPRDEPPGAPRSEVPPPPSEPRLASRTPAAVPLPKSAPSRAAEAKPEIKPAEIKPAEVKSEIKPALKPAPAKPTEPPQQSAAIQQAKPADAAPPPAAPAPTAAAKPDAPQILPTEAMPKVQGLE